MPHELPPALRRMLELWNGEEIDPASVYAPGCRLNGGPATFDPPEVASEVAALRAAFPDLRFTVEDGFRAGDRHVVRLRAAGRHTGTGFTTEIGTAAPTGATIALRGIEVFEVVDDRIVDVWVGWDFAPLYAALGARFEPSQRGHGPRA